MSSLRFLASRTVSSLVAFPSEILVLSLLSESCYCAACLSIHTRFYDLYDRTLRSRRVRFLYCFSHTIRSDICPVCRYSIGVPSAACPQSIGTKTHQSAPRTSRSDAHVNVVHAASRRVMSSGDEVDRRTVSSQMYSITGLTCANVQAVPTCGEDAA